MAGGGTKPIEIKTKFDPREVTLGEVVSMYARDARAAGRKIADFEKEFQKPGLKEMLDRPAIDMFEGSWDGELNPLEGALQGGAESTHRKTISAVSNIQRNVLREATRLKLGSDLLEITKTVYIPPKSKAYTKSFGYNPYKIGDLTEALVAYVEKNPADKPIANAIMFQLQTGLRPSAVGGLPTMSFKQSERPGGAPGLFIPQGMKGVKTNNNINIPLSRRSIAILQDQTQFNDAEFGGSDGFFVKRSKNKLAPITDDDINRVLKSLNSSFGIKKDLTSVNTPDVAYLTSYDLRRLNATAFDQLGVDVNRAGALIGRPIQANTEQSRYIGAAPGIYGDTATEDVNKLSNFFHQQYAEKLPGAKKAGQQGKSLSLNAMIFSGEQPQFVDIETEAPAPITIKRYDVGTDVPVEDVGKAQPKAAAQPTPKASGVVSPELADDLQRNKLDLSAIFAGFGKKGAKVVLGALGVETARQIIEEPAAFAKDIAIEGAALAAKAPLSVAGALPAIFDASPAGEGSDIVSEQDKAQVQADFIASQDAGFVNIDRGPEEAAPANSNQGFLSR